MRPKIALILVLVGILVILTSISIYSLPRLAAEHGTPCITCHINPNGGGQRNEFGNYAVAFNELCLQKTKKLYEPYKLKPRISDNVTWGLDARTLFIPKRRYSISMQTDFYLSLEMLKNVRFNLTLGQNSSKDGHLLITLKDKHYWIKAGHFYPAFGLRDPDHTAYVRKVPSLLQETAFDGISVGGNFFNGSNITVEYYQPAGRNVVTFHSFRAGSIGPVGFLTGVSWRQTEEKSGFGDTPIAKSLFGGLSYNRFTALGEVQAVGKGNEQRELYAQLEARVVYGIYILGEYNFHDPNWNVKSGTNEFWRGSIEFFPIPFVEIRPSVTRYNEITRNKVTEFFVQLHVSY